MKTKCFPAIAISFAVSFLILGCGQNKITRPEYPGLGFKNVDEAPEALRQAAEAVVLIFTGTSSGTGAWVSKDGRLMTNNHVLGLTGSGQCAREGCYIHLTEDFQLGSPIPAAKKVFAEPLGVQPEFDVTLYQIWKDGSKKEKVSPARFLTIKSATTKDLRKTDLHVIGHPMASVKKWSTGKVIREIGKWAITSHFALPGNSGSPILNNAGEMVGIIHRKGMNPGDHSERGPTIEAIGSASADFEALLTAAPKPDPFFSVHAVHTAEEVVENERAYLLADVIEAKLEGDATKLVIDILAEACDTSLKKSFFESPDTMSSATSACADSVNWLEVLNEGANPRYQTTDETRTLWETRLQGYRALLKSFNSTLGSWLYLPTKLAASPVNRRSQSLKEYLTAESPEMSFELALYVLDEKGGSARDAEAIAFTRGYRDQPSFQNEYKMISKCLVVLYSRGLMSFQELEREFIEILNDEATTVADKLYLEAMLYRSRLL